VRSAVIPQCRRGANPAWRPGKRYRGQLVRRLRRRRKGARHRRVYGQCRQGESGCSRLKRRPGSAPRARKWSNQKREIVLQVATRNLIPLAA